MADQIIKYDMPIARWDGSVYFTGLSKISFNASVNSVEFAGLMGGDASLWLSGKKTYIPGIEQTGVATPYALVLDTLDGTAQIKFKMLEAANSSLVYAINASIGNLYLFNTAQEGSIANLYARVNYVDSCLGWTSILTTKTNASLGLINIATLNASIGAINTSLNLATYFVYKHDASLGQLEAFNDAQEASISNLYARVNYVDSCLGWTSILTTKTNASLGLINIATLNASIGAINASLNLVTHFSYKQDVSIGIATALNTAEEASIANLYARVNYVDSCLGWTSILASKTNASLGNYVAKSGDTMTGGLIISAGGLSVTGDVSIINHLHVFGETTIDGSLNVKGNLQIDGSVTYINTTTLNVSDNFIRLNTGLNASTAPPATLQSGILVTRGLSEPYAFIYDETDQTFRIGIVSKSVSEYFNDASTQAVATRQDSMVNYGIPWWDGALDRLNTSTGLVWANGGTQLFITGDACITGKLTVRTGAELTGLAGATSDYALMVPAAGGGLVSTRQLGSMAYQSSGDFASFSIFNASIGNLYLFNTAQEGSIANLYARVNYVDSCLGWASILASKTNASLGLINIATLNASIGAINVSLNLLTHLTYKQDVSIGVLELLNDAQEASIANLYARVNYVDSCLGWTSILTTKTNASLGLINIATLNASIGAINASLNLVTHFSYKQDVSIGIATALNTAEEASIANLYARVNYVDSCLGWASILSAKSNASIGLMKVWDVSSTTPSGANQVYSMTAGTVAYIKNISASTGASITSDASTIYIGVTGAAGYMSKFGGTFNGTSAPPIQIAAGTHLLGIGPFIIQTWDSGVQVFLEVSFDGSGNVTINWVPGTLGASCSYLISG